MAHKGLTDGEIGVSCSPARIVSCHSRKASSNSDQFPARLDNALVDTHATRVLPDERQREEPEGGQKWQSNWSAGHRPDPIAAIHNAGNDAKGTLHIVELSDIRIEGDRLQAKQKGVAAAELVVYGPGKYRDAR